MSDDLKTKAQNQEQVGDVDTAPGDSGENQQPDTVQAEDGPGPEAAEKTIPEQEEVDLQEQLEKARTEAAEYLEGWQRARAEFANYRKRVERERQDVYQDATMSVLKQLLPIIDDLERAMDHVPPEIADHQWVEGIALIAQKFHTLLESNGLEEINPVGEAFDPIRHEAVGMDDHEEIKSGHVTAVLQKGYAYGDKVLRPALVRVAN